MTKQEQATDRMSTEHFFLIDSLLTEARLKVDDAHTRVQILTAQTMLFNFMRKTR